MRQFTLISLTLRSFWICVVLLSINQTAMAYDEIQCKQLNCGIISNTPKTSLLSVNPDPLTTVDRGDAQNVTVKWSVRFGLRAKYELCATDSLTSGPQSSDPCITLPGATLVNSGVAGNTFEDALTLSAAFYQPTAEFYIQTTSLIHLIGNPPSTAFSNRLVFVWPLKLPNLYAHNPKPDLGNGLVQIQHDISNIGMDHAGASVTEFVVSVCDGLAVLPSIDPDDPESESICTSKNARFMTTFSVQKSVSQVAVGARERYFTDITSLIPTSTNGLWVSVTAYVDVQQDIDESNEFDNVRFETSYIIP